MKIFLLILSIVPVYSINKISWTLSKPPANLFRWETSKDSPTYTQSSLSEGTFILQAIATDANGQSTHSGVIQGNISTATTTVNLILNPLIQADAARFQQPSYIEWVKTNSTTVYPNDIIKLTIRGKSNPPNTNMQFTLNGQVRCTSTDVCIIEHTIPENTVNTYSIDLSIINMGYDIPMEFIVKRYVPVEFRAVFNIPPTITNINSAISLLHQIGTSTTISATFEDNEGSDIKYTWSTEAISGSCPITDLSGSLTGTVVSGSTVATVFTPATLGNKCIVKIRCEDVNGGVSLGEVFIYVDNIPLYFPPYVVSKLQSKQSASIGNTVDFSIEICEPQQQMITIQWQTSCGTLDHSADTVIDSSTCTWLYNDITLTSVPCSVSWTATDSDSSVSSGTFRILAESRRLKTLDQPIVFVKTSKNTISTEMIWEIADESHNSVDKNVLPSSGLSGSDIALIIICSFIFIGVVVLVVLMKMRKMKCVLPDTKEKKVTDVEMPNVNTMKKTPDKNTMKKTPDKTKGDDDEDIIIITPKMMARGSRRQMRLKRAEKKKRHVKVQEIKNKMLPNGTRDMHLEHDNSREQDNKWTEHISHHKNINVHRNKGIKRVKK
jgi:hypothetical protein